jgi:hypothetical protein
MTLWLQDASAASKLVAMDPSVLTLEYKALAVNAFCFFLGCDAALSRDFVTPRPLSLVYYIVKE